MKGMREARSAPLDGVRRGHMVFERGSIGNIRGGAPADQLFSAQFGGKAPAVRVDGGKVTWSNSTFGFRGGHRRGDIALNEGIPWNLDLRHGTADLIAQLSAVDLRSFVIRGGSANVEIVLGRPRGTVPITIAGGSVNVRITRPRGTSVRLSLGAGCGDVTFDGASHALPGRVLTSGGGRFGGGFDIRVGTGSVGITVGTA